MSQQYLEDIQSIKSIMEERTRFLSLSGMSGILAGCYALIGAFIAHRMTLQSKSVAYRDLEAGFMSPIVLKLAGLAALILFLSLFTAYFFTAKKAKRRNEKLWTTASARGFKTFSFPLLTGGIFILFLILKGHLTVVGPATLIFYGLALFSASQYTYSDIGALGILEVLLGLLSMLYPGKGLWFWAIGFGALHIIYGILMHFKYDKH